MRPFAYPLGLVVVMALVMAPTALAEYEEGQEPCPPDTFCTTSTADDGTDSGNATSDPDEPISYNPDGDPERDPYSSGPADGQTDGSHVQMPDRAEVGITSEDESLGAPALVVLVVMGAIALVAAARRHK